MFIEFIIYLFKKNVYGSIEISIFYLFFYWKLLFSLYFLIIF